jgi:hypothetical protein
MSCLACRYLILKVYLRIYYFEYNIQNLIEEISNIENWKKNWEVTMTVFIKFLLEKYKFQFLSNFIEEFADIAISLSF